MTDSFSAKKNWRPWPTCYSTHLVRVRILFL